MHFGFHMQPVIASTETCTITAFHACMHTVYASQLPYAISNSLAAWQRGAQGNQNRNTYAGSGTSSDS